MIAMVMDYIDGHLAIKNNEIKTFSKLFDLLVGKIMTTIISIGTAYTVFPNVFDTFDVVLMVITQYF